MAFCAIDFGTSNSTLGVWRNGQPELLKIQQNQQAVPTAIFFPFAKTGVQHGHAAVKAYLDEEEGRFMRGLKGALGTNLFGETTQVLNQRLGFADIIASYLGWLGSVAEQQLGERPTQLMLGRPVHFLTNQPDADAIAETHLREAAALAGFAEVTFMPEPLAAAWHYEQQLTAEELVLIIDIGGGTADFSLIRLNPARSQQPDRSADLLAGHGLRLGGSGIDKALSLAHVMPLFGYQSLMDRGDLTVPATYYNQLTTWHRIHTLYGRKTLTELAEVAYHAAQPALIQRLVRLLENHAGHKLSFEVEDAKIRLSQQPETLLDLAWCEPALGTPLTATQMAATLADWLEQLTQSIQHTLNLAGVQPNQLSSIFLTGGPSAMPLIQHTIQQHLPHSRLVRGDTLTSVGHGLILAAHRSFNS